MHRKCTVQSGKAGTSVNLMLILCAVGLVCARFGAPGLYILQQMDSAWDGEQVYPRALEALDHIKQDGTLLLDSSFVIWELDGSPASTDSRSKVLQAVLDAAAGLSEAHNALLARLASHTAASIRSTLHRFAADLLPGGRNTKAEVGKRFSPAEMECFPDMPPFKQHIGGDSWHDQVSPQESSQRRHEEHQWESLVEN
jgi:hypothetical protein